MDILKLDTDVDSSPSTSSNSSSPSPVAQSDTTRPTFSRQNSQTYTLDTASTSSLPTPTVKFAPLPTIGPRKRKSNQPLGMAARAQLMRKRRGRQRQEGGLVISASPMWTSAELEEQRLRIESMAARHAEFQARENAREVSRHCVDVRDDEPERRRSLEESAVEDPILVFGKIVKVAGKTLWKRMSKSKEAGLPGQERREHSPSPILIKPLPPLNEPVPLARTARADAWYEPTQEPETQHDNDVPESKAIAEQQNEPDNELAGHLEIVEVLEDEDLLAPTSVVLASLTMRHDVEDDI